MSVDKAIRLLATDKVRVTEVLTGTRHDGAPAGLRSVAATVVGDTGTYDVTYTAGDFGWACNCKARGLCSHLTAVALVTGVQ